jgi:hypothetical protein
MNKITVFWIEDNPIQTNEEEINGKKYPKFLHADFFAYCIFQHPKQVDEYLSMISKLNGNTSLLAEKCQGALADIVVFDYKLSEAFKNNTNALSYTDDEHYAYLISKSASHKLKKTFDSLFKTQKLFLDTNDVRNGLYMADKFKTEIRAEKMLPDDEFGLYCGIAIIREFKEYITVGVPATINKADKTTMSNNSLFYEWLNSYDLKGAIERPIPTMEKVKDWSEILNFSADLLRKRIETQIGLSKITINLPQLMKYAESLPETLEKRIFTFESTYGERHLPLDGLFIDVAIEKRDKAILEWIKGKDEQFPGLLGILATATKIDVPEINNAKLKYKEIYDTYKEKFLERILLSDFSKRETEGLLGNYKELLDKLKLKYSIEANGEIHEDHLCSIELLFNNKELKKSQNKQQELRLTILMLATRLWIDHQIGNTGNSEISLSKEDYYYVLNPIVNAPGSVTNPLTLLMHSDIPGSTFMDSFQKFLKRSNANIPESDWSNFMVWIKPGEQIFLKAFFQSDLYELKKLPDWLS